MGILERFSKERANVGKGTGPSIKLPFKGTENTDNGRYDVYEAKDRQSALQFLREVEVKEPFSYVIVETPAGNLGKDVISIYDDADGSTLELGARKPLPNRTISRTHCTNCG